MLLDLNAASVVFPPPPVPTVALRAGVENDQIPGERFSPTVPHMDRQRATASCPHTPCLAIIDSANFRFLPARILPPKSFHTQALIRPRTPVCNAQEAGYLGTNDGRRRLRRNSPVMKPACLVTSRLIWISSVSQACLLFSLIATAIA